MPYLLDCLLPACHQASAVTTPAVAGVTFPAVVAVVALAVTVDRLVCPMGPDTRGWREPTPGAASCTPQVLSGKARESGLRRQPRDSCIACFKADLAAQGNRTGARCGAFPDVIAEPSELVAALSPHRAVAGARWRSGRDGVELLVRYRLCGHRGHAEEESAK